MRRVMRRLNNGQGSGSTETGAYTLNGALSGIILKNSGASTYLPSESEWYKAAYYDPNKGGAGVGGYWLHANQSNTMTTNTVGAAGAANYFDGVDYAVTQSGSYSSSQNYLTAVGAYGLNSDSAYGTNDQAGNVYEWNDAVIGSSRGLRGGSWDLFEFDLRSSTRNFFDPTNENGNVGFRVASVPEPTSLVLTILAGSVMLVRRKR